MSVKQNPTVELKVTSLEELKKVVQGELVELPPFTDGTPFVARLKRPSMLALVQNGKIPNPLLTKANKLFSNGVPGVAHLGADDPAMLGDLIKLLDVICQDAFVEPKYNDLKEAGIGLTDEQYMAVFSYTQNGVKSLENFRKQR